MDLLRYSDTVLKVCLKDKPRREVHDLLRQIAVYPTRVRVCPCVSDPWIRKTLAFLGARLDNEPSHQSGGSEPNREFSLTTEGHVDSTNLLGVQSSVVGAGAGELRLLPEGSV